METAKVDDVKISIIMPTYNYGHFIGESIQSVLAQTYQNWELIVIDNYSDDNTEEVVSSFDDPRIHYLKFRNNGVIAASRNEGIRQATGQYVGLLDSDDLWAENKLELVVQYLHAHPETVLLHHRKSSLRDGKIYHHLPFSKSKLRKREGRIYESLLQENIIAALTVVVKKEILDEVGCFNESKVLKGAEDWDCWLRIARKYRIDFINESLALYREHEAAFSRNIETWIACNRDVISRHVLNGEEISKQTRARSLAIHHVNVASLYVLAGQYRRGLAEWVKSISIGPFNPRIYIIFIKMVLRKVAGNKYPLAT